MSKKIPSRGLVYLATKYPLLSETFIYEEILTLKRMGYQVCFFVLYATGKNTHEFAKELEESVYYLPANFSIKSFLGHFYFLLFSPKRYFGILLMVLRETLREPLVMLKSIYAFGKGVSLANILRKIPQNHIHAHWATMPTTVALVASRLTDTQYSFTSHAWDIFKEPAMLDTKLENAVFHTTISQYNKNYLKSLNPEMANKIYVNRCGVNLDQFVFRSIYPAKKKVEILFVGRLVEKKGTLKLIDACLRLRKGGYDFVCNIIGNGPQKQQLEKIVKKYNLEGYVNLVGGLPREQLRQYWENAGMFVLPCIIERDGNRDGIPVVLMEAMASGIPVISTMVSGIPELIDDGVTGLLVKPDDIDALSGAMLKIIEDVTLAQQLVENARAKVVKEYNIKINTGKKAGLIEMHIKQEKKNDV